MSVIDNANLIFCELNLNNLFTTQNTYFIYVVYMFLLCPNSVDTVLLITNSGVIYSC